MEDLPDREEFYSFRAVLFDQTRALKHRGGRIRHRRISYCGPQDMAEGAQIISPPCVDGELKREMICRLSPAWHTGQWGEEFPWRMS
jgi:hypothetical protein